jgi:hypothetical protein
MYVRQFVTDKNPSGHIDFFTYQMIDLLGTFGLIDIFQYFFVGGGQQN